MFKKTVVVIFLFYLFFSASFCLSADTKTELEKQLNAAAGEKGAGFADPVDPRDTIAAIIKSVLTLLGFIFLLLTLYAGFLWMTAGGDEGNIEKAKAILTAAVIGLAVILLSYSITIFVFKVLTLKNIGGGGGTVMPNP